MKKEKTLIVLNKTFQYGFGVTPFIILRNPNIPFRLKPLYELLLSYAWYNAECFPGQQKLSQHLGITDEAIRNQLKELRELGLIDWKVRGQGKTNIYYILEIPEELIPENIEAEPNDGLVQEPNVASDPTIEVDEELNKVENPLEETLKSRKQKHSLKRGFGFNTSPRNNYPEKREKMGTDARGVI